MWLDHLGASSDLGTLPLNAFSLYLYPNVTRIFVIMFWIKISSATILFLSSHNFHNFNNFYNLGSYLGTQRIFNHTISRILTQQEILFDFLHARHTQKLTFFFLYHKWCQKSNNFFTKKWISDKRIFNRSGTILIIWSSISLLDYIIYIILYLDVHVGTWVKGPPCWAICVIFSWIDHVFFIELPF